MASTFTVVLKYLGLEMKTTGVLSVNFIWLALFFLMPQSAHSQNVGREDCVANFTYYQDSAVDLRFHFQDLSTGPVFYWVWDFGDGNQSFEPNPKHTYAAPGNYYVCLEVGNAVKSNVDVFCDSVMVPQPNDCHADFSYSMVPDQPFDVHFQSLSSGHYDSLHWQIEDGSMYFSESFLHTFSDTGWYDVDLIVWNTRNPYNCRDTLRDSVHIVFQPCVADFSSIVLPSGVFTYQFENTSTGMVNSYLWNISDGTSYTSRNLVHTFSDTGWYYVQLRAMNTFYPGYCYDIYKDSVYVVFPECIADWSYEQNPNNYFEFSFLNFSSPHADKYIWSFGDGSGSFAFEPVHEYETAGKYQVSLRVMNSQYPDYCDDMLIDSVEVIFPGCFADFDWSGNPEDPYRITFENKSEGLPNTYLWSFGDGNFSTEENPFHVYQDTGHYYVSLKAFNTQYPQHCNDIHYDTLYIEEPPFNAAFSFEYGQPYPGQIAFINESSDFADTWEWDFGDGSFSELENPQHLFIVENDFRVCLSIGNSEHPNLKDTWCDTVFLADMGCDAAFDYQIDPLRPFIFAFNAQTGDAIDNWQWDFGDGTVSDEKNPDHIYSQGGTYTVKLLAWCGGYNDYCMDSVTQEIYVDLQHCSAVFDYTVDENYPSLVHFSPTAEGSANDFTWYFGDGTASSEYEPSHTYAAPGNYVVSLMLRNTYYPELCEDSVSRQIKLEFQNLKVDFDFVHDSTPGQVNRFYFYDRSEGNQIKNRLWTFGDGTSSRQTNPQHQYLNQQASYQVKLKVTDYLPPNIYITDSLTKTIHTYKHFDLGGSLFLGNKVMNNPVHENDTALLELYRALNDDYWVKVDTGYFYQLGYYFFPGLIRGIYAVRASLTENSNAYGDFLPAYFENSLDWKDAQTIDLTQSNSFHSDIHLKQLNQPPAGNGVIDGKALIIGQDVPQPGLPAAGKMVLLIHLEDIVGFRITDDEGAFVFSQLGMGEYQLFYSQPGYISSNPDVYLNNQRPVEDTVCVRIYKQSNPTAVGEEDFYHDVLLYPNPAKEFINIFIVPEFSETVQLELHSAVGRRILSRELSLEANVPAIQKLDAPLATGQYFVTLLHQDGVISSYSVIFVR